MIETREAISERAKFAADMYKVDSDEIVTEEWLLSCGGSKDPNTIHLCDGYFAYEKVSGVGNLGWYIFSEDNDGEEHEVCFAPPRS